MGLKLKTSFCKTSNNFTVNEITGLYDVIYNQGGWGTPNLNKDFTGSATVIVTNPIGNKTEYDVRSIISNSVTPNFELIKYQPDEFIDGIYEVDYIVKTCECSVVGTWDWNSIQEQGSITFNDDLTGSWTFNEVTEEFTYEVTEDSIIINEGYPFYKTGDTLFTNNCETIGIQDSDGFQITLTLLTDKVCNSSVTYTDNLIIPVYNDISCCIYHKSIAFSKKFNTGKCDNKQEIDNYNLLIALYSSLEEVVKNLGGTAFKKVLKQLKKLCGDIKYSSDSGCGCGCN